MKKLLALLCTALLMQCTQTPDTLKEKFAEDFLIGAAVGYDFLIVPEIQDIAVQQFNCITPENQMKFAPIHPQPDKWNWQPMDTLLAFAQKNGLEVIGHTLAWHSQTPVWVFMNTNHELKTPEELSETMQEHITTVMTRYKGKILGYDVVNEALQDPADAEEIYRPSFYYQILGKEFMVKAFELAHAVDPDAELYYNDYNLADPVKRENAVKLIKFLQSRNVRLDAIGMQAHWNLYDPAIEEVEKSIIAFSELGIKVMITELDMSVYKWGDERNIYETLPDSIAQMQTERYKALFQLFKKHSDKISRVTMWGIDDKHSWLNNFPVRNRTNHPLLYDREFQPKPVLEEILNQ